MLGGKFVGVASLHRCLFMTQDQWCPLELLSVEVYVTRFRIGWVQNFGIHQALHLTFIPLHENVISPDL